MDLSQGTEFYHYFILLKSQFENHLMGPPTKYVHNLGVIWNAYCCLQEEGVSRLTCTYETYTLFSCFDSMFILWCFVLFVEI